VAFTLAIDACAFGRCSEPHAFARRDAFTHISSDRESVPPTSIEPLGPEWLRRPYLGWITLGCSVLLTVLAWDVASRSVRERIRAQFVARTDQIGDAIDKRMVEYESALRGVLGLFAASDQVTRQDLARYLAVLEIERDFPGLQGVGFAPQVSHDELDALIATVRAEGFSDYDVWPRGKLGIYTPIVYLEPHSGRNLRAFGFDMYSDETRREAMQRAARTGQPAISGVVRLVQETAEDVQRGFLMYLPVHHPRDPGKLLGFVYSPFRSRDLMLGILGGLPADVDYAIVDGESGDLVFETRPAEASRSALGTLTREVTVATAGRSWKMRFRSRGGLGDPHSEREPLFVLLAGVVINLLLFYIIGTNASLSRRARALATSMTGELRASYEREQQQILNSLREKETLLKEIHHRVKNNLQVVSSLLSLQRSQTTDPRAIVPLRESQHRVLAMAALHEYLYQSHDLTRVDTRAYLTHVVRVLTEAYQQQHRLSLQLELSEIPLDVDRAIPCGLITNELVSNALKYACVEGKETHITVALRLREREIELEVADDGPGLPSGLSIESAQTLGLMLVQLLTEQIGGSLAVEAAPGARFRIRFPYEGQREAA
jgi:two-component sensor histidine kinase/sensor domain CHASE-containing protein